MSLHGSLNELERRYREISVEIEKEQMHVSADDLKLAELKRRKLQLKDQMVKLKALQATSVH